MMNTKQRTKHLSQVQSTQVAEASKGSSQFDASDPATSEPTAVTNPVLSVDLESASKQVNRQCHGYMYIPTVTSSSNSK